MPPHKSEDYKISAVQYYLSKIRTKCKLVKYFSVIQEV